MSNILEVQNLTVHYGVIEAIKSVSFNVKQGEVVSLIGANGAGKTTTLRAISNLLKSVKGEIKFKGSSIRSMPAHKIVHQGICHVPEGRGIFLNLTVEENLDLGAWSAKNKEDYKKDLEYAFHLFPRLKERIKQNAGTLSGGEQQMLAIGRALMSQPELILLDEPSLGLAPQMIEKIFSIIQTINKEGKTILLVEQNARKALQVAHHAIVFETGKLVKQGPAKELLNSDEVKKAYLGE